MAWVALDRGIKAAVELGLPANLERWERVRAEIQAEVLERGWDEKVGAFVQAYEYPLLDAANLRMPLVGFLPAQHPKMRATIEKTREVLAADGLVYRYLEAEDGLPGGEATFAICTFWLIENLIHLGRLEEARALFERMLGYANDLGLYAEEIDPTTGELLGNFPQGFTHIGLLAAAINLARAGGPGAVTAPE